MSYETEPVSGLAVALAKHDFWGNVLGCAADAVGDLFVGLADLGQSEIGHFDVSFLIQQYILGFQIAVDDIAGVEVLDGEQYFCCVEFGDLLREFAVASEQVEEFALSLGDNTPGMRSQSR
jgi:hypothetical protein